jgi:HEPN domain-containing protein
MTPSSSESDETKALLDDFAIRSFRDMADNDYVLARMAIRAELGPQFLWSSLQAIEKYLKAILFINRVPSTKSTHSVSDLLAKVQGIKKLRFSCSSATRSFVEYLDK